MDLLHTHTMNGWDRRRLPFVAAWEDPAYSASGVVAGKDVDDVDVLRRRANCSTLQFVILKCLIVRLKLTRDLRNTDVGRHRFGNSRFDDVGQMRAYFLTGGGHRGAAVVTILVMEEAMVRPSTCAFGRVSRRLQRDLESLDPTGIITLYLLSG